ncbi:MAG: type II secretion system protein GspG [Deltaproteobacteria bacterium]|nr:type II secretion system protein GspG [Deltaproteobacteria bacterium]
MKSNLHPLIQIKDSLLLFMIKGHKGLTLIELLLVVGIIGTLSGITIPAYTRHRDNVHAQQAVADILNVELTLDKFYAENGRYPDSLADIGKAGLGDPWGNPYQYLNLANDPHLNQCRKIRNIHPVNTCYDLYSSGKDGMSQKPLNAEPSWDDIIRAYDGSFIGLAREII